MSISNSFLDPESEFGILNNATINALGWKADKSSNFDIKVSITDKDGKTVISIGNFTHIDDSEPESILCLEALDPPKEKQDSSPQVFTISFSSTSEEDLKKMRKL
ncbi:13575_t:CDS:2 [Ambispora gerdemannii]|uniref:13575_t:CDS:1 n=1 Tax=Ambispora gerdemannii TaxID=144530 RepID=A0A9N9DR48_9GLOM|nr:13575_t:CDS:2 [Ambispora gerdemannii]